MSNRYNVITLMCFQQLTAVRMMFVLYDSLTDDACEHSKKEHKQNFANQN